MPHILTQTESNEVTRDHKQMDFCNISTNATIIDGYPPFKRNMAALLVEVNYIEGKEAQKDVSHHGTTVGKMSLKVGFADFEIPIMNKVRAFSLDPLNRTPDAMIAMTQLEEDMTIRHDEIISMKDADVIGFAEKIKEKVTPFLPQLFTQEYDVVVANLDAGIAKATLFKNSIGAASTIEAGAHVAGVDIHTSYVRIIAIQKLIKLNLSHWDILNPDFVLGMKSSSVVDHLGHSNTVLKGVVTGGPENTPLDNATVQNKRNLRFADINILAQYELRKFHAHLDFWEIKCPGFQTKLIAIKTQAGKTMTMDFHLDPIVPAP